MDDTPLDLFAPVPPEPTHDAQRPHLQRYAHIATDPDCADVRGHIREWWRTCKTRGLLDSDFDRRFAPEFSSRVWELRLGACLVEWGLDVGPSPKRDAGPDFRVTHNGCKTWFEAVCANPGDKVDHAVFRPRVPVFGGDLDRRIGLRMTSAISEKREKWRRWSQAGLVSAEDAFVIALSGSMIDLADFDIHEPRVARLLFGFGGSIYQVSLDSEDVARELEPRSSLTKSNGTTVTSGLFADDKASEVSAVLFSAVHAKGIPERQMRTIGSEMILVVNPFAAVPWSLGQLPIAGTYTCD